MLGWLFAGAMLLLIVMCVAIAMSIAAPWDLISRLFGPMFSFWGEFPVVGAGM